VKKPVDWAERKRIVEDLESTFLVEAGAGSGKTRSLVDRMIALLRTRTCRIDTLASVTFTRKAGRRASRAVPDKSGKRICASKGRGEAAVWGGVEESRTVFYWHHPFLLCTDAQGAAD